MAALSQFGPNRSSNQFGAGSLSAGLSAGLSAAGGLGNFQAVPVGRSSMDPTRMAEQLVRRARSQGDLNTALRAGMIGSQLQQEQAGQQKLRESLNQMTGGVLTPAQPQAPQVEQGPPQVDMSQQGWANQLVGGDTGSRAGNVQKAMQDPQKFAAIRNQYNKMAAASGMTMDEQGNIVKAQAQPAQVPGSQFIPDVNKLIAPGRGVRAPAAQPTSFVTRNPSNRI